MSHVSNFKLLWAMALLGCISTTIMLTVDSIKLPPRPKLPSSSNPVQPLTQVTNRARAFPFCIDGELLKAYTPNLAEGPQFEDYLKDDSSTLIRYRPPKVSKCMTCGDGTTEGVNEIIERVDTFRIYVEPGSLNANDGDTVWELEGSLYRYMRQWFHVHITTKVDVEGLLVQSMAGYQGLPHGQFSLEFGCKDCGSTEDRDLTKGGFAAVLPCKRRTYLHARHPNVYVFARTGTPSNSFHMHFNYLDVGGRDMKTIQFIILAVKKFGEGAAPSAAEEEYTAPSNISGTKKPVPSAPAERFSLPYASYMYTPAINHNFQDSPDGAPYPYHVTFKDRFNCHTPDDSGDLSGGPGLNFQLATNALIQPIWMEDDYDSCLVGKLTENIEDSATWLSDLVCSNPERTKVDYSKGDSFVQTTTHDCKTNPNLACVCVPCTYVDNDFTAQALPRLIRRGYMARRFHGIAMIAGCVSLSIVSIHVARYFKEDGGGCILVGWWFWIHACLSYISFGAVWTGFLMGLTFPDRPAEHPGGFLDNERKDLGVIHMQIGAAAVLFVNINYWLGPIRAAKCRALLVFLHAFGGYLVVIFGVAATMISVACREEKLFVLLMTVISILPYILACMFQVMGDSRAKLTPSRKYIPIIEAVRINKVMPKKIPRIVLVGVLMIVCLVLTALCALFGGYKGVGVFNSCENCVWKHDDMIVVSKNESYSDFTYMDLIFKCDMAQWGRGSRSIVW